MPIYSGIDGIVKPNKNFYTNIDGVQKEIKTIYAGNEGVVSKIFSSSVHPVIDNNWTASKITTTSSGRYDVSPNSLYYKNGCYVGPYTVYYPDDDYTTKGNGIFYSTNGGFTTLTLNSAGSRNYNYNTAPVEYSDGLYFMHVASRGNSTFTKMYYSSTLTGLPNTSLTPYYQSGSQLSSGSDIDTFQVGGYVWYISSSSSGSSGSIRAYYKSRSTITSTSSSSFYTNKGIVTESQNSDTTPSYSRVARNSSFDNYASVSIYDFNTYQVYRQYRLYVTPTTIAHSIISSSYVTSFTDFKCINNNYYYIGVCSDSTKGLIKIDYGTSMSSSSNSAFVFFSNVSLENSKIKGPRIDFGDGMYVIVFGYNPSGTSYSKEVWVAVSSNINGPWVAKKIYDITQAGYTYGSISSFIYANGRYIITLLVYNSSEYSKNIVALYI